MSDVVTKTCTRCAQTKAVELFYRSQHGAGGRTSRCKTCIDAYSKAYALANRAKISADAKEWRAANRESVRAANTRSYLNRKIRLTAEDRTKEATKSWQWALVREFGITAEQYARMLAAQDGVCNICKKPESRTRGGKPQRLAVDHDHATGKVRALLCRRCNTTLGAIEENFDLALGVAKYIQHHRGVI